jgi:hypothetical protein
MGVNTTLVVCVTAQGDFGPQTMVLKEVAFVPHLKNCSRLEIIRDASQTVYKVTSLVATDGLLD